jgi:NADPH:quinone reductase-like Zn-dependent oxidoreductase
MNTAHTASRPGSSRRRRRAVPSDAETQAQRQVVRRPGVGSMAVGSVEAIGGHAVGFARGDRVVFPLSREERTALDAEDAGDGMGTLIVSSERLLGVPRDVGDEQAARLLAPGLATRVLLKQLRPIGTGDRVRIDLEPGIVRAVVSAWATALGATVEDADDTADAILDEETLRQAHALAFRRGHLQVGSAEVFAAIRNGAFDDVLGAAGGTGAQAAA